MPLHRMNSVTIGVPDVSATTAYYEEFGLRSSSDGWLETTDGGAQLRLVKAPTRRLVGLDIGVDDPDDVARIAASLRSLGVEAAVSDHDVRATEPVTGAVVTASVTPHLQQVVAEPVAYNGPGRPDRGVSRAPAVLRHDTVRPRKLGHVVLGSTDQVATQHFFTAGFGLKVSDSVRDAASFLRCSTDHHNVLVQSAPVNFLHHTSWQVDDIDEIGRGATAMLEEHPERHVWGLGRHHIGSNFFWYLRDPAGNFSEYYADLDCIVDDELWTPRLWEEDKSLYSWGPPPPPSFVNPEDLAAHMAGAHSTP
ncbi:VOC family protein [Amycolatopsis pithecellobii]|uniref:Dioxygenase n=1 Tax=Amycolatopsis pithecellobii TaxID=664692 RepID=A0A6N7Z8X2_9PSEU|nr:VOC family protein [Amycolatopsis pithecellobii]MTD57286.1 dioxygenase [Amycolatopsis pithecellobii]